MPGSGKKTVVGRKKIEVKGSFARDGLDDYSNP
jgi:hypothetical protein